MSLNAYAAEQRLRIFEELKMGLPPSSGEYDPEVFRAGKVKGEPQMGSTRYEPHALLFEFIYPDPHGIATVLTVRQPSPERIVFLPVPSWVVESIWQGEIDGSFQFEADAERLLEDFRREISVRGNQKWFEKRMATRRE